MKIHGSISLYDMNGTFIYRKKYDSKISRNRVIERWVKLYSLKNKMYYISISPNI